MITARSVDGNVLIDASNQSADLNLGQMAEGDTYRFSIDVRAQSDETDDADASETGDMNLAPEPILLKVIAVDSIGLKKELGVISSGYDKLCSHKEIIVFANDDYQKIQVIRNDKSIMDSVYAKNIRLTRLNVGSQKEADDLKPTFEGKSDAVLEGPTIKDMGLDSIFTFDAHKSQTFGQTFKAENEYLSSIALDLKLKGKGGLVSFNLELHIAEKNSEGFRINPEILQKTEFRTDNPSLYLDSDGLWRISIPYHLEKNKYYFIGINNANSESNYFNNISLIGSKSNIGYGDGYAGMIGTDGQLTNDGEMNFKIYSLDYQTYQNNRIVSGAFFEDLGGVGKYGYGFRSNISDYLDIFSIKNTGNTLDKVFFDPKNSGVIGVAQNDQNFIYKLDMIYPIKKVRFLATDLGADYFRPLISYSFDQQNWTNIPTTIADNEENVVGSNQNYTSIILGDGKSSALYIKISYDINNPGLKEGLFGIKNLSISADLNTSN
ncbi:MAG: hypothetical protein WCO23_04005 [bacterium]